MYLLLPQITKVGSGRECVCALGQWARWVRLPLLLLSVGFRIAFFAVVRFHSFFTLSLSLLRLFVLNFLCVLRFRLPLLFLLQQRLLWQLADAYIDHYMQLSPSPHTTPLHPTVIYSGAAIACRQFVCPCIVCKCVFISLYSRFTSIHRYSILFFFLLLWKSEHFFITRTYSFQYKFSFSLSCLFLLVLQWSFVHFVFEYNVCYFRTLLLLLLLFPPFLSSTRFIFSFKIKWLRSFHCLLFILAWISSSLSHLELAHLLAYRHFLSLALFLCVCVCSLAFHILISFLFFAFNSQQCFVWLKIRFGCKELQFCLKILLKIFEWIQ